MLLQVVILLPDSALLIDLASPKPACPEKEDSQSAR
jgi:hypothetical protein